MEISSKRAVQTSHLQCSDLVDDEAIHFTKPIASEDDFDKRNSDSTNDLVTSNSPALEVLNQAMSSQEVVRVLKWAFFYVALFIMILMSSAGAALGQSYDLRFVEESNDGSTLGIKIQMAFSATAALGSSNVVFSYDPAKVSTPLLQGVDNFDQSIDADYAVMTLTSPVANTVSLNIELQTDDAGTSLSFGVWTDVATVDFTITDNTGTADFQWELSGTEGTVVYLDDNITLLSGGGLSDESVPLPVELTSFEAMVDDQVINLLWTTAAELNNDYFEVHRSQDGLQWTALGTVDGNGTTNEYQHYRYTDTTAPVGASYYRLKQVDYDGAKEYSYIIRVEKYFEEFSVSIYPNPAVSHYNIELKGLSAYERLFFQVVNLSGHRLIDSSMEANEIGRIDTSLVLDPTDGAGTYFLLISSHERQLQYRLLKE